MIIAYLLSKDGLRLDEVDVALHGVRLGRDASGFVAQTAAEIHGTLRVTLADLSAAIARPEVVDQLLAGVPGIARPELTFANGDNGGIRIVGSVEALGAASRSRSPRRSACATTASSSRRCASRGCR